MPPPEPLWSFGSPVTFVGIVCDMTLRDAKERRFGKIRKVGKA